MAATSEWKDVTKEFAQCCQVLPLGEIMHQKGFSLFEGMSAIEMMDPKMDSGMLCNQKPLVVSSFKKAVEMNLIPIDNFTNEQIIDIIDDTFSNMIAWLEGHYLAQTIFTNMYLHDPELIVNTTISSFSFLTLKLVDTMHHIIRLANVYEEEDTQLNMFNFRLFQKMADSPILISIKESEDHFNKIAKNSRSRNGIERDAATILENVQAVQITSRLKFLRLFYTTLSSIYKEKSLTAEVEKHLEQLRDCINNMMPYFAGKESTGERVLALGFEPMVNQHLLPPTFPRCIQIPDRQSTWIYMDQLIVRIQNILPVVSVDNVNDLFTFMIDYSYNDSCLLTRSLLQIIVLPSPNRILNREPLDSFIRESIKNFSAPPILMPRCKLYSNDQMKEMLGTFLLQASNCVISLLQICGQNNARQRDKYVHLLDELTLLQVESEKLDSHLNDMLSKIEPGRRMTIHFGTWSMYLTLRVMLCYVLSGLQLELYSQHEYVYIYWYLCEGLFSWLASTLLRADEYLLESDNMYGETLKKKSSKRIKTKKKILKQNNELLLMQALQNLNGGYYKALIGLQMQNKLKLPKYDFDSEEVRYNHRFLPFASLHATPHLSYQQFKKMTDVSMYRPPIMPVDLFSGSSKCFSLARQLFESLVSQGTKVGTSVTVAKTNCVFINLLISGYRKDSLNPIEFDFKSHKFYPIMKLT